MVVETRYVCMPQDLYTANRIGSAILLSRSLTAAPHCEVTIPSVSREPEVGSSLVYNDNEGISTHSRDVHVVIIFYVIPASPRPWNFQDL